MRIVQKENDQKAHSGTGSQEVITDTIEKFRTQKQDLCDLTAVCGDYTSLSVPRGKKYIDLVCKTVLESQTPC